MQVAILAANARQHDAIGNLIAEKVAFFHERGFESRVFVDDPRLLHPHVRAHAGVLDRDNPEGSDWDFLRRADLILVEFGHGFPLLEGLPLFRSSRNRILFCDHGVTPVGAWQGPVPPALRTARRDRGMVWFADHALVQSRFTKQELIDATGYPSERISPIGLPVVHDELFDLHMDRQRSPTPMILFVGRLASNKRVETLIEALGRLPLETRLVLVGDDKELYAWEAERLGKVAEEIGVADRIEWRGQVGDTELLHLYGLAHVFAMPSVHEGFCMPVADALAAGVPVAATKAGALPETLEHAGILFDPGNSAALADAIQLLATDSVLRNRLTEAGRVRAESFRRERWREHLGNLIEQILDADPIDYRLCMGVAPSLPCVPSPHGKDRTLFLQVTNQGKIPALSEGPGRTYIRVEVGGQAVDAELPTLLLPGESTTMTVTLAGPLDESAGEIVFRVHRGDGLQCGPASRAPLPSASEVSELRRILVELDRQRQLPEDYFEGSAGWFGTWKRWLKGKLLGNFRKAYVDVLSRQQSHVNGLVMHALACLEQHRAESRPLDTMNRDEALAEILDRVTALETRRQQLEERLIRLEQRIEFESTFPDARIEMPATSFHPATKDGP